LLTQNKLQWHVFVVVASTTKMADATTKMADAQLVAQEFVTQQLVASGDATPAVVSMSVDRNAQNPTVAENAGCVAGASKSAVDDDTKRMFNAYVPADKLATWTPERLLELCIHFMEARETRRQQSCKNSRTAKRKAGKHRYYYKVTDTYHPEHNPTGTHEKRWKRADASLEQPDTGVHHQP
jgi:hypothetical protein